MLLCTTVRQVLQHASFSVPQVRLDLDLSSKLVLDSGPEQLVLLEHLQRYDVVGLLLSRQVHRTKLALAQRQTDLEVRQAPVFSLLGRVTLAGGGLPWLLQPNALRSFPRVAATAALWLCMWIRTRHEVVPRKRGR